MNPLKTVIRDQEIYLRTDDPPTMYYDREPQLPPPRGSACVEGSTPHPPPWKEGRKEGRKESYPPAPSDPYHPIMYHVTRYPVPAIRYPYPYPNPNPDHNPDHNPYQIWPKSCGHVRNKRVVPFGEAVARVKAACEARDAGADIVIVARTDARQAVSLEEALRRVTAFARAGADVLFIDALESEAEMRAFCATVPDTPKMASILEGGGKTPTFDPATLHQMGFRLVAYPLSVFGAAIRGMQQAMASLRRGEVPPSPAVIPTFGELQEMVGFPEYYALSERYEGVKDTYETAFDGDEDQGDTGAGSDILSSTESEIWGDDEDGEDDDGDGASGSGSGSVRRTPSSATSVVEADSVMEEGQSGGALERVGRTGEDKLTAVEEKRRQERRATSWLRVKITNVRQGKVTIDTRLPAMFLDGLSAFVPTLVGMELEQVIDEALGKKERAAGDPLISIPIADGDDLVEVWLE